jgi:hypothetical protein
LARRFNALADTTAWLARPSDWDKNRGTPEFSDKKLARIQFASALVTAAETGALDGREAIVAAAVSLLPDQESDGAWRIDSEGTVGSPVTYGSALATYSALRVLNAAADSRFTPAIEKARAWLAKSRPTAIIDRAAVILALGGDPGPILRAQTKDGGWGPYPGSPPEVFDTAVSLLALASIRNRDGIQSAIDRGRQYLIAAQLESGGWHETTRPPGARSYAQHISTTGWAAMALLATRPAR